MNETIVKHALRELIIYTPAATDYTKAEALDELLRMEREAIRKEYSGTQAALWNASMAEFRNHRASNSGGRIGTIKLIRERLQCGLSEALIIVKGIETQDGIV
jgi:hypothetical protein